ncbi:MAG: serine/threonine-protein phosphatase [Alphaproteobacteria bacterium]|nr:serine/threonine-protein phosphatase [Alphaproteobacteria bacterium]
MPSSDLVYVLAAPDLEELGVAGEAVLDGVGDFRVRIDGTTVLAHGEAELRHTAELPILPGSNASLDSERAADDQAVAAATAIANTHVRLLLQEHLENRLLFSSRHLHAVDRTVTFLGQLDEERVRVGILAACMDVVDAPLGALLEHRDTGWQVLVDLGVPGDIVIPALAGEDGLSLKITDHEFGRLLLVPLGSAGGFPAMVCLADWSLGDPEATAVLQTVSRLGRVALENARLVRVAGERQRLRIELELAGRTQLQLMPTETPHWPGLDVVGHSRPTADCGGDYFDWFELPGRGFAFCVADVSGHGVSAAIVMSTLRGYLRAALRHDAPLQAMLAEVSDMLCDILEPWQFVTVFVGEVVGDGSLLRYCNAGHEAGLLVRNGGTLERLDAGAPPLGIDATLTPSAVEVHLEPGDVLVVPTDGLAEAENPWGGQIGRDRLEEWVVQRVRDASDARAVRDALLADVARHRDGADRTDDETLLVVRREGRTT